MAIHTCTETGAQIIANGYGACQSREVNYEGAVLALYEDNGYDDSDFGAVVWDGEKVRPVIYGTTRSWTYHNGASVDATDEVQELALAWYRARWAAAKIEHQRELAVSPGYGATVRSLTTKGKNVGVQGVVRWTGEGYGEARVGIRVEGESRLRFLAARQVEVVDPPEVDPEFWVEESATRVPANWRSALFVGARSHAELVGC